MYILTPQIIAKVTGGRYIGSDEARDAAVLGAVRDNRDAVPGSLFVCIRGERTDGHLYANTAFEAGAACCLAEREIPDAKGPYVLVSSTLEAIKALAAYHRGQFNIPIIGITGSVGKTTAKELIAATLGSKLKVLKTEKNLNNELGVPLTLLSLSNEHEAAVVEMGISDFGEMSRLADMVRPDIFVITNIGYAHTEKLGDLDGVIRAKTEALAYMKPEGVAVLNGDDALLREYDPRVRKITFGLCERCDYRAENIKTQGVDLVEFDIVSGTSRFSAKIPAYGTHLAALAPSAVAIGHLLGLSNEEISRGLSSYSHIEGRSNISNVNGITLINDCYNANPNSVKAALDSLSQLHIDGRRIAILGDMLELGIMAGELHFEIGKYAAACGIDILLCCGDTSRRTADGFAASAGRDKQAKHYSEIEQLKQALPSLTKKGDAVLVKASHSMHFEKLLPYIVPENTDA